MLRAMMGSSPMLKFFLAAVIVTGLTGFAEAKITVSKVNNYEEKKNDGRKIIRICKKAGSKKKPVLQCETVGLDEVSSYCTPPQAQEGYEEATYASGCCFQKGKNWQWLNNCIL
jgi:hypothetical protein